MPTLWRKHAEVFHTRAKEYDSWFEDSLLFDIEAAAIASLSVSELSPSLEIGVGPGRFAEAFDTGFGIDPARAPLHLARSRNIAVCQAVGEALPFRAGSMARISLFFTLCFVANPTQALAEIHNVLQGKGQLLLGFVPANGKWGKNLQHKKETGHPFYQYANFFSTAEVVALLEDQGFTVSNACSTLYQDPGNVSQSEIPKSGMDEEAGFVALLALR
jgi:ubiquinone/menaquinone biosynthesis C-methylase UbiE